MSVLKSDDAERKRRTYLRGPDRRAQILEVAKAVFATRGYHAANVAHICHGASIGRGTLYQYFGNKGAVMLALLEDLAASVKRVIDERQQIPEVSDPISVSVPPEVMAADTRRRVRELLDVIFQDEQTLRLVLRERRGLDHAADGVLARIDEMILGAIEHDLKGAQSMGVLRAHDSRLVARFLLGGIEKVVLTALARDEPIDLDAITEVAVDMELFGLLPPGPSTTDA